MITTVITESFRKPTIRTVRFTMPNVAPLGVDWTANHGGRNFELVSFKGGPVEVYVQGTDGLMMYQGTVVDYAPGGGELLAALRRVWYAEQPSAAARASFEASAVRS